MTSINVRLITPMVLALGLLQATGCSSDHDDTASGLAAFKACGGSLTGTWQVVASEVDAAKVAASADTGLPSVCRGMVQSVGFDAKGATVTYAQSTANTPGVALYDRTATGGISWTETLSVSPACATDQYGGTDCTVVASALKAKGAAQCSPGMAPCSCTLTITDTADAPDTVTVQGGQFTTEKGDIYTVFRGGGPARSRAREGEGLARGRRPRARPARGMASDLLRSLASRA